MNRVMRKGAIPIMAMLVLCACGAADKQDTTCEPIWAIMIDGTTDPVDWTDHGPNPRFAIYDPGTGADPADDLVCDKATRLVWTRDANPKGITRPWFNAIAATRQPNVGEPLGARFGSRMGWRLPTVVEMLTLVDPAKCSPTGDLPLVDGVHPALPTGHPFINVQATEDDGNTNITRKYWTSTTSERDSTEAITLEFNPQYCILTFEAEKTDSYLFWPVRGGDAPATGSW